MLHRTLNKLTLTLLACLPLTATAFDWQQFIPNNVNDWQQLVPDWQKFIPGNSEDTEVHYGPFAKNHYEASNLTVFGPLSLTNSKVENTLTVFGPAVLENTTNEGLTIIFGVMNASNSTLNDIHAATTELKLSNTSVNHILVLKNENFFQKTQHVYLSGSTIVSGTITFEQGNGKVVVSDKGIISEDRVIGGKIKVKK